MRDLLELEAVLMNIFLFMNAARNTSVIGIIYFLLDKSIILFIIII